MYPEFIDTLIKQTYVCLIDKEFLWFMSLFADLLSKGVKLLRRKRFNFLPILRYMLIIGDICAKRALLMQSLHERPLLLPAADTHRYSGERRE